MRLAPLVVADEDRAVLESVTRSRTAAARDVQRARIVLLAAEGWSNRSIGAAVGLHYNQVAVWRDRYRDEGMTGLVDTERPGRPPVYDADDVILLVKTATEIPPEPVSRWTMEALARRLNEAGVAISASQVWRICQALDLKPWQYESWMTSHDPDFWPRPPTCADCTSRPPLSTASIPPSAVRPSSVRPPRIRT
jgi:transposase